MMTPLPDWLSGVSSLADLVKLAHQNQQGRAPDLVWMRCALAGEWNRALYPRLLQDVSGAPGYDEFAKLAGVANRAESCALAEEVRQTYLKRWKREDPALAITSAILETYHGETGDTGRRLQFLALANSDRAIQEFDALYKQADHGFDLGRCEALLRLLRTQYDLLSDRLRQFLNDREQYLQSREIFSADYYRSLVYMPRARMESDCEVLLAPSGPWIVNLYGLGGLGKTMFVRRLIAHRCVPEYGSDRTPVARVDLDFVDLAFLAENPWLLLLEAARQLRPQMAGSPFITLLGPEQLDLARRVRSKGKPVTDDDLTLTTISSVRRRPQIEDLFVMGIAGKRVLLIIDTIEEFLLHRPKALLTLLDVLVSVRNRCPEFRVLLSGRYWILDPDRPSLPLENDLKTKLKTGMTAVSILPFTKDQSRDYLRDVRHLENDQVVGAIVKRSNNPFELSLFADLATSRPLLTVEAVEACPDAKLAYLVERVIDRMPDEPFSTTDTPGEFRRKRAQTGARWLVRYAVIPQELTFDFVKRVLRPFLEEEMSGTAHRDRTEVTGYEEDRWRREHVQLDDQAMEDIWQELQKYAASYNWVEGDQNAMQLHAEVVVPMRELLRERPDEYPIYGALHQAAAQHFESQPKPTGKLFAKALYHRFQKEGSAAGPYWQTYRALCRGISAAAVRDLAKSVLTTKDYLDDRRQPLRHYRAGLLIDTGTLAEIALEYAHASLLAWLRSLSSAFKDVAEAVSLGRAEWQRFGGTPQTAPRGWLPLLDAAEAYFAEQPKRVRELLEENWIVNTLEPEDKIAARMLLMRVLRGGQTVSDWQYLNVLETSKRYATPAFPEHFLRAINGQYRVKRDTSSALDYLDAAMEMVIRNPGDPAEAGMMLQWFGDLAFANGEYARLERRCRPILADPDRFPFPVREQAADWLVPVLLESCRYAEAWKITESDILEPVKEGLKAEVLLRRFQVREALERHGAAETLYKQHNLESGAVGERLALAEAYLKIGNISLSKSTLGGEAELNETVHGLTAMLLRLRVAAGQGNGEEARTLYKETLERVAGWRVSAVAVPTVRATLLASGAGSDSDASDFLRDLRDLSLPASRFAALRPFLDRQPGASIRMQQFRDAVAEPEDSPDWFAHNLAFAGACAFFEDTDRLERALRRGIGEASNLYSMSALRGLIPPQLSEKLPPNSQYIQVWIEHGPADASSMAVVYLQEAEQEFHRTRYESSRQYLDLFFNYVHLTMPAHQQWSLRGLLLLGQLEWTDGRMELAAGRLKDAAAIASEMNNRAWIRVLEEAQQRISVPFAKSGPPKPGTYEDESRIGLSQGRLVVHFQQLGMPERVAELTTPIAGWIADAYRQLYPEALVPSLRQAGNRPELTQELQRILTAESSPLPQSPRLCLRMPLSAASAVPWEIAIPPEFEAAIYRSTQNPIAAPEFLEGLPGRPIVVGVQLKQEEERFTKRGYGVTGLPLQDFYERSGFEYFGVNVDGRALSDAIAKFKPAVLHISGALRDMTNPTDVFLDYGTLDQKDRRVVRPGTVAQAIQDNTPPERRPLIILDTYWDPEDHARQVMLRNRFAASLFETVMVRGILAVGDYQFDQMLNFLEVLPKRLSEQPSLWELYSTLRRDTRPLLPPALFSAAPDGKVF